MRDSVPSARYSSVCNVLHQRRIGLIPTYRIYRLYDINIYFYTTINPVIYAVILFMRIMRVVVRAHK